MSFEKFFARYPNANSTDYWQTLNPQSTISSRHFVASSKADIGTPEQLALGRLRLREEGYYQSPVVLSPAILDEMCLCIENVKQAGYPPLFALVYDVFWQAMANFDSVIKNLLGNWLLIPNFWIYFIENNNESAGFEPHTDATDPFVNDYLQKHRSELFDDENMPKVITLWIALSQATPLNGMYVVPIDRDPNYANRRQFAINEKYLQSAERENNISQEQQISLQNVRAIPTEAGTLSCWNPYVIHWGCRSSKFAEQPRISIAVYCQKDDIPIIDDTAINFSSEIDFDTRLSIIYRGMERYNKYHD